MSSGEAISDASRGILLSNIIIEKVGDEAQSRPPPQIQLFFKRKAFKL
jgi:hypothetical protein